MESFRGPRDAYRLLKGNEIRVIKVKPFFPGDDPNHIEAQLFYIPLDSSADYFALSYVWGDASRTRTISLDGQDFPVTDNLWWALNYARAHYDRNRKPYDSHFCPFNIEWDKRSDNGWTCFAPHWWIDAICINQSDLDERSKQIPRMRDLYGMATRVVIWLGLDSSDSEKRTGQMVEAAEANYTAIRVERQRMEDLSMDLRVRILREQSPNLGELIRPLVQRLAGGEASYFGRIWTLQEMLVAQQDPAVMIGQHTTSIEKLDLLRESLNTAVRSGDYDEFLLRGDLSSLATPPARKMSPWRSGQESFGDTDGDELCQFGLELYSLLARNSHRSATNPHDRIYGLLGLTSMPALPNDLVPDYDRPFEEVCYQYSKFLVQSTGVLEIFDLGVNRHHASPSWVPTFSHGTGGLQPATRNTITFTEDGKCMQVSGVQIGTAIAVHDEPALRSMDPRETPSESLVLSAWFDLVLTILRPAAQLQSRSLDSVAEEWANHAFVAVFGGDKDKLLQSLEELSDRDGARKKPAVWNENIRSCAGALGLIFLFSSHFVLEDGTVCHQFHQNGHQQEKPMVGDRVCAFRGTLSRTLLRPLQGTNKFSVQGSCWTFPAINIAHTKEWFSGQEETLFNLF